MTTYSLRSLSVFCVALCAPILISGCGAEQDTQEMSDTSTSEALETANLFSEDLLYRMGLSRDDRAYLLALAASHSYQGQMGNLVATHTHNPDTREFGRFFGGDPRRRAAAAGHTGHALQHGAARAA